MSFGSGGFGGFGQNNNNNQSSGFGGFGASNNNNSTGKSGSLILLLSQRPRHQLLMRLQASAQEALALVKPTTTTQAAPPCSAAATQAARGSARRLVRLRDGFSTKRQIGARIDSCIRH